jgi:hypothetical protein
MSHIICSHLDQIHRISTSTRGCEECLKMEDGWVHLCIVGMWAAAIAPKTSMPRNISMNLFTRLFNPLNRKIGSVLCGQECTKS